jgi:uncharacterized membrane protein YhaH (DUF805 family)
MGVPATEEWFSVSIRRNRKSFIIANIILFSIFAAVIAALLFFDVRQRVGMLLFVLFFIPFIIAYYFLTAQRLRDMNVTGWLALLHPFIGFLPEQAAGGLGLIFILVLCAVPGTEGANRYGEDPLFSARG